MGRGAGRGRGAARHRRRRGNSCAPPPNQFDVLSDDDDDDDLQVVDSDATDDFYTQDDAKHPAQPSTQDALNAEEHDCALSSQGSRAASSTSEECDDDDGFPAEGSEAWRGPDLEDVDEQTAAACNQLRGRVPPGLHTRLFREVKRSFEEHSSAAGVNRATLPNTCSNKTTIPLHRKVSCHQLTNNGKQNLPTKGNIMVLIGLLAPAMLNYQANGQNKSSVLTLLTP